MQLAAAGADQVARATQIKAEMEKYKLVYKCLKAHCQARCGRYSGSDSMKKNTADEALKYLHDGITLSECQAAAAAERNRLTNERWTGNAAHRSVSPHAAVPDAWQCVGVSAASAQQSVEVVNTATASPQAAGEHPPDENENDNLPEDVDKRYSSAPPVQMEFNACAQSEALVGRGGENVGGGYWRHSPPRLVQLGG